MENERTPELVVREVNDRAYSVLWGLGAEEGDFACECGQEGCEERVDLLVIEYAARDSRPLLAPGHRVVAPTVYSAESAVLTYRAGRVA
jgi:hypothetical protein